MNNIEESIKSKKEILKSQITDIKSFSIYQDKNKLKKIAHAYEHSGNLLQRTSLALDNLLCQSEIRVGIYVVGIAVMIFVLLWKLNS